ncbi:putative glycerophosphodiester phosphodiesterase, protein kinase RLK-Pelle-LRK10L-2 family [Rosa chinensis]|uniref:non-specific serine/threonine protein kinase n=1 Tax=Rosa chinensis TaxID=74649 RepID=A0A2P6QU73_ROSCH|nr:putative glycerophosphodiester phosphodiesterase, protein kinase RLK-Pelle-LRK10L-2 family [Rosa chinensis]
MYQICNLFSPLMNICVLIILWQLKSSSAVDSQYKYCSVPKTCGNVPIKYPFYLDGQQESYCGYPGFQLYCNGNGHTLLSSGFGSATINTIDYENHTLHLSHDGLFDHAGDCLGYLENFTSPNGPYELAPNQKEFVLLYYCNSSLVDESFSEYKLGCFDDTRTRTTVLALTKDDPQYGNALDKCGKERETVEGVYANVTGTAAGIREGLKAGFVVNWSARNCSLCENSGGKCGTSVGKLTCFCPDKLHDFFCPEEVGAVAGVALLVVIVWCSRGKLSTYRIIFFWKLQNQKRRTVEAFLRNYGGLQVKRYSYLEVKKMTNSFKRKLGQGGYGGVYKGKLNDGRLVAVKVLNRPKGDGEDFMNEVAAISTTSHVNIVSLLGFCFEGSKRALIYEFMPNGSLEKFIFDAKTPQKDHHLGWDMLETISLGIAQGLEYLHRGCSARILHFDIKPHNILLDENFWPKISDFGLAKICDRKESIVSMLVARGTAGYIAPEVFCRNFGGVSHKSDVYSYGMMLSEMAGGRKNINVEVEDTSEIYFPHWIYKRLELDQELGLQSIMNGEDEVRARKMIIVSLWCIQTDPSNRPSMKQVIEMLEGNVESLQIPPKPYLSSSPKSLALSSPTLVSIQ